MTATDLLIVVSSLLWGASVGCLAWTLAVIATLPRAVDPELGRFEEVRRRQLRQQSWVYRVFEPWIEELAAAAAVRQPEWHQRIRRQLTAAAEPAAWLPAERLAGWQIEALMAAAAGAAFGWFLGGELLAGVLAAAAFFFHRRSRASGLAKRADRRRQKIKRQLASGIDLLALMIEVGGSFHESLAAVARRTEATALGDELARVLADIDAGRSRKEALRAFADRIGDDDASELVFAIVQGEELGTPLTSILRNQADQMRQKRSQWAEKVSQEAQVTLVFPAIAIMVACLIIAAAPFVLMALMS
jgi:tight adherence protein C